MEEQKNEFKKIYVIIAFIILIGGIVFGIKGFNKDLNYISRKQLVLINKTELNLKKIEDISKQILNDRKIEVKRVEKLGTAVEIVSTEITDEEKVEIINKVNEELGIEISEENVKIYDIPETKIIDVLKPYIKPGVIASVVILIYLIIVYHKLGIEQILLKGICIPIVAELVFYAIVAITRIPFGIITNSIALAIYVGAIKCITTMFQIKKEEFSVENVNKKEND